MDEKKSKRFDLEGKKTIFFEIGLIISLLVTIVVFRITSGKPMLVFQHTQERYEAQIADITVHMIPEQQSIPVKTAPAPASKAGGGSMNIVRVDQSLADNIHAAGDGANDGDIGPGSGEGEPGAGSSLGDGKGKGDGSGIETVVGRVRNRKNQVIAIVYFRISKDKVEEFERNHKKIIKNLEKRKYPGATPENPTIINLELNVFDI